MLKSLALLVCVILTSFGSIGMNREYVRYEEGLTADMLRPYMDELSKNKVGFRLLNRINALYDQVKDQCSSIVFKPGRKTSFSSKRVENGRKTKLVIEVANLGKDEYYPCLHDTEDENIKVIFAESSPFWLVLAHELIHLKHKLEEISGISSKKPEEVLSMEELLFIPYSRAQEVSISDIFLKKELIFFRFFPSWESYV